ncbi:STAS domain-containing protein [Streptomyces sp. WAC05950]|uniref:STAS domain-containing protein n=1 Tax=Streptomyces sp. WAC05950 TaxID=2487419 RepID=UPI00163C28AA|nr:STAS domain-containing protein [Streptomyces sp. WAC05950]
MTSHPELPAVGADPADSVLAVVVEPGPQRVPAHVSGEIDMDGAGQLRADLTAALCASPGGLDVDLAAVTFCDSSGLHVLLDLDREAKQAGKSLVLTALSRPVARLLRITGAEQVLTVHGWPSASAQELQIKVRRYGPTVHLTPAGELCMDTQSALDEVQAALDGVDVVACDMRDLTFLDVVGLRGLLDLVRRLDARGIAFFAYNWQAQARSVLDRVDEVDPPAGTGGRPTRLLRRLQDFASAARMAGAARARNEAPDRAVSPPG